MTRWIEVSVTTDGEAAEAIAQELQRWCHQGIAIEQAGILPDKWDEDEVPPAQELIVRGYFPDDARADETKAQISRALSYMNMLYPMPQPIYSVLDEQDWANAWKAHYHPVRVGQHLVIRPLWTAFAPAPGDIVIALDPGMAFGTGTHPTTQLCLQAIEALMQPHWDVLDLGCGSGILAIAAARLQATKVVAVDIDPLAVKITRENAEQNGVADRIIAQQGSLETLITSPRRFDFIVVNILAKVIIALCDQHLGDLVRPGGKAIFSGIIHDQTDDVEAALRRTGLRPIGRDQQGDWLLITAERPVL